MNRLFKTVVGALALAGVVVIMSCGGGDSPQALAKQGVSLLKDAGVLMQSGKDKSSPEVKALEKKSDAHREKVDKLSPEDKKIYDEELGKLMTEAMSISTKK